MKDLIGRTLGHYRIVEKIGEGGMGEVYRAEDERLDRDVAIKVLPEEVAADPERLARFEREAKLLASLNHPNIATLHGLEKEESRRFLVMELVEGESLAGVIARGPIPFDKALPINDSPVVRLIKSQLTSRKMDIFNSRSPNWHMLMRIGTATFDRAECPLVRRTRDRTFRSPALTRRRSYV